MKHDEFIEKIAERKARESAQKEKKRECVHYPNTLVPVKGSNPLRLRCKACGAVVQASII